MKKIILIAVITFIYSTTFCQVKISIDSVTKHYGEKVTICSKVYGTKALEKVTFINLGAAYPNSLLTVVIFTKDKSKFKEAPEAMYTDKTICVTGELKEYNSKSEIIVSSPDQITIQ
jgi:aspartyl/asparaginyl-tRNA synthetase